MKRRGLSSEVVGDVLANPGQRIEARRGREIFQPLIDSGGARWLIRVVVDMDRQLPEVVTACRTGKIAKYWRERS